MVKKRKTRWRLCRAAAVRLGKKMAAFVKENGGDWLPSYELVDVGVPELNLKWFQCSKQYGGCVGLPP